MMHTPTLPYIVIRQGNSWLVFNEQTKRVVGEPWRQRSLAVADADRRNDATWRKEHRAMWANAMAGPVASD